MTLTASNLRATFESGVTRPLAWRTEQLHALRRLVAEGEEELLAAVAADLGKPPVEALVSDISFVGSSVDSALAGLDHWMRPERVRVPPVQQPARASIVREPYGVALVMAPWNYPVHLLLAPMAAAIAAGNCVLGKPSELAPETSKALARLVPLYLDQSAIAIVEGGVDETQTLLAEQFDYIFFTGSTRVGKVVMRAAAEHLTPVTLELGGKSPVIVDADADMAVAARRIAWGKFLNAGQSCVAPDYVLVHRDAEERLVSELARAVRRFYGPDPEVSADYARIVNDHHFGRLVKMLDSTAGRVAVGGHSNRPTRYMSPTVLTGVKATDPVMEEEIFGPILPVIAVDDVDEAVAFTRERPKPLALYVFTSSAETADSILARTSSGGACVNTTVLHLAVHDLPFGGVGASGMGSYHGRWGFETFSHRRAVLRKPTRPELGLVYPPHDGLKGWMLRKAAS
jgi:aldehyde dehydrogenase (NAD+)